MSEEKTNLYEGMYIISATLSEDARAKALEKIQSGIYTLSLHDALPIIGRASCREIRQRDDDTAVFAGKRQGRRPAALVLQGVGRDPLVVGEALAVGFVRNDAGVGR